MNILFTFKNESSCVSSPPPFPKNNFEKSKIIIMSSVEFKKGHHNQTM